MRRHGSTMLPVSRHQLFALIWLVTFLAVSLAHAHPHVRINVDAAIVIEADTVRGVRYAWHFDQAYLEGLKEEYDTDRDGTLSDAELQVWLALAIKNLAHFKAFTHLKHGAGAVLLEPASDIRMQRTAGGLTLQFFVKPTKPVNVKTAALQIDIYDATFFTEFVLGTGRGVVIEGAGKEACLAEVALAPGGQQQKAISAFMKVFGKLDAKLAPAKAITVTCGG